MSRNRFTSILKFLRFDNRATRQERQLAPFRDSWSLFQVHPTKFYIPCPDLCVDEQLVAFRERCGFPQLIPSKLVQSRIKIWWGCDSQTCYPLNGEAYLGRQPGQQREVRQGARVVKQLMAPWRRSGRNVTPDNFFTSIPLAKDLLKGGLTYVGTLRSNKPHMPDAIKANNTKQVNSSLFGFNLVSYLPKEKQAMLALSTMYHDEQVDGDAQKSKIIPYYNSTKSAVDNFDHLANMYYTYRRKVNRWPVALFVNVVDVAAVAVFIIWIGNFPQWKIFEGKRRRRLFL
ncbi:piggyBac transposable element-derived protein 4-like [Acropora muricata]|uniref:piggyBac transposable element-derived protein 4-like n=1 Tax=Acropora muricata TaxID=159855 RepID=UPI0034E3C821